MVIRSDKRVNTVFLSLGSNLGDRIDSLNQAIERLSKISISTVVISNFFESEPWGNSALNGFVNGVVAFETELSPFELLSETQQIEIEIGRGKKTNENIYENREIDIDILTFGIQTLNSARLTIPHPFLTQRKFVLKPLQDIFRGVLLPHDSITIEEYLQVCRDSGTCTLIE